MNIPYENDGIEMAAVDGDGDWEEIFAQVTKGPFESLQALTHGSRERLTRAFFQPIWGLRRFASCGTGRPKVLVLGQTREMMQFDGKMLGVFGRLCGGSGPQWIVSAPGYPKAQRPMFNALNIVRETQVIRKPVAAALDMASDVDVLIVAGTQTIQQARQIIEHPAFAQCVRDGKPVLWTAWSEIGVGIARRWLTDQGFAVEGPHEYPLRWKEIAPVGGMAFWIKVTSAPAAIDDEVRAKADEEVEREIDVYDKMLEAWKSPVLAAETSHCIGTTTHTVVDGEDRPVMLASATRLIDRTTGDLCERSDDGTWRRVGERIPQSAMQVFPEQAPVDELTLRLLRMSWLARALEMASGQEDQSGPDKPAEAAAAVPQQVAVDAKAGGTQESQATHAKPARTRVKAPRGKGVVPVLAFNAMLGVPGADPRQILIQSRDVVCNWLRANKHIEVDAQRQSFSYDSPVAEVTIEQDDARLWAMRFDDRRDMTNGAFWRVELTMVGEPEAMIGLRVAQIRVDERAQLPQPAAPTLVQDLAEAVTIHDKGTLLRQIPREPSNASEMDAVASEILDTARSHPVVAFSIGREPERVQRIADRLAKRLVGVAQVVLLRSEGVTALKERLGSSLSVFGDAARVYFPGLSVSDDPFGHPYFVLGELARAEEDRMLDRIAREACAWGVDPRELDERVPTFAVARQAIIDRRVKAALEETNKKKQSTEEERAHWEALAHEQAASLSALQSQLKEREQEAQALREEVQALTTERDNALDELRRERHKSSHRWDAAGDAITSVAEVDYPESWDDLQTWAEIYGDGRLVLHPLAVKAARNSQFRDVPFAYRVLHMLVDAYVPMKTRAKDDEAPRKYFEQRCKELGVEITSVGKALEDNRYANRYRRKFGDRVRTLDLHVSTSYGGRDPALVFRCYFTYDEDAQQVLVGHMPSHLDNSLTHTS